MKKMMGMMGKNMGGMMGKIPGMGALGKMNNLRKWPKAWVAEAVCQEWAISVRC